MTANLDVAALPLQGLHLIEASAGTGKTWTIALLYLRLLLERDAGLRGIAVVTFTEAATRELRERLRRRVGEAVRSLRDDVPGDAGLEAVLAPHRADAERQRRAVARLEAALTGFDEARVSTIHGLCRQLLADTAFESGLPFVELDDDANGSAVRELVRDFWRQRIVTGDEPAALELAQHWSEPDRLATAIARSQALALPPESIDPREPDAWLEDATATLAAAQAQWRACLADGAAAAALAELLEAVSQGRVSVDAKGSHHVAALDTCAAAVADGVTDGVDLRPLHRGVLVAAIAKARRKGWIPGATLDRVSRVVQVLLDGADELRRARHAAFFIDALAFVRSGLAARRERLRRFGFDDLIRVLHDHLHGPRGGVLAAEIAQRLPALLVDEFQDTDPLQYAILGRIHAAREDGVMFLIGDPKQAIYRFRGGDVFTYQQAVQAAGGNAHTLNGNRRSDERLITAVNSAFDGRSDAFLHSFIRFQRVHFPEDRRTPTASPHVLTLDAPLVVWRLPDLVDDKGKAKAWTTPDFAARVLAETARAIKTLLSDPRTATTSAPESRRTTVAVLVNTNRQAEHAAEVLAQWNIPCDHLGTASVYAGVEAQMLLDVLAALAMPGDAAAARAALATELLGASLNDLLSAREDLERWESELARLAALRQRWLDNGPYAALSSAVQMAAPRLLSRWDGRRRVTNLLHLAEALQHVAGRHDSPEGLRRWLAERRQEAADHRGEGAREQVRPADDPGPVQVLTIHRSKGLEFDVVFAPFLARTHWMEPADEPDQPVSWHADTDLRIDVGGPHWHAHALAHRDEQFAESLRLTYVALTRARHRCHVAWAHVRTGRSNADTSLRGPLAWLWLRDATLIAPETLPDIDRNQVDSRLEALAARAEGAIAIEPLDVELPPIDATALPDATRSLRVPRFEGVIDRRFETLSYSRLFGGSVHMPAADHDDVEDVGIVLVGAVETDPDAVVIPLWPRGAAFGNCVHEVLEKIPFAHLAEPGVSTALSRIAADHGYADAGEQRAIAAMARAAVTTPLPGAASSFTLAALARGEFLSELGFLFPLPGARLAGFDAILDRDPRYARAPGELAHRRHEVAGLMTGYIDLVVRWQGRYFVVDYKTNLLGAAAADYAPARLPEVIRAHDYDLQYLLYLVAVQRFLRARLGVDYAYDTHVGGALYLFVRGLGSGDGHGIHADRPPREVIDALDRWCAGEDA